MKRLLSTLTALALAAGISGLAQATTVEARAQRGADVIRHLNKGKEQPALEAMRREFPFLAEATEAYALGDVWSRPGLDDRTRQLVAVATMAALGETGTMRVHAGYALNIGVTEEELKEVIYLVTVPAGFPRAISASQVLAELFEERREAAGE
ncbi:carboxymuconolactone decarboxylase family protein [Bordetella genomosp. 13]|uniref:4-carboxymuconolactone decarboxylase n=1 Tax=Bordetella genomosp. 13 TaxID=463040 RepID=A0A1W6ZDP5_9BORD|nr:carboxymuconolactone decarboxylase family protein [Bordetella genomosp. 13]ARP95496.1 4-carboxymuconolactone decarboxylase [Bordetella genomosp. 13]